MSFWYVLFWCERYEMFIMFQNLWKLSNIQVTCLTNIKTKYHYMIIHLVYKECIVASSCSTSYSAPCFIYFLFHRFSFLSTIPNTKNKNEHVKDENSLSETTKYLRGTFIAKTNNLKCSIKGTSKDDYGGQDVSSKFKVSYIAEKKSMRNLQYKISMQE